MTKLYVPDLAVIADPSVGVGDIGQGAGVDQRAAVIQPVLTQSCVLYQARRTLDQHRPGV